MYPHLCLQVLWDSAYNSSYSWRNVRHILFEQQAVLAAEFVERYGADKKKNLASIRCRITSYVQPFTFTISPTLTPFFI